MAESSSAEATEARLRAAAEVLSADDMDGRGIGTAGIDAAADYIAEQFEAIGLEIDHYDGTPFQKFTMTSGAELGDVNHAKLVGPGEGEQSSEVALELDGNYTPLALGGSGELDLPLVFVGYGITAPDLDYDDYEGIDATGKAVIVMRHEPQQNNPHSLFDGTRDSSYAPLVRKVSNAYEHGAAAVIFCTDETHLRSRLESRQKSWTKAIEALAAEHEEFSGQEDLTLADVARHLDQIEKLLARVERQGERVLRELDPLLGFSYGGAASSERDIVVLHVQREALDVALRAAIDMDLAHLERDIDEGPQPQSRELDGWRLQGQVSVERTEVEVKNVVAVLPGEGPLADETIVVGAHYDHVGYGGPNSLAPGSDEVHNGADDNASGTVVLVEVARRLAAAGPLPRTIVFIAFTAEEEGLIGSARYVRDPLVPLENTVAMLNMDMVGRLDDERKLIVQGTGTAAEFEELIDGLNEQYDFDLSKTRGGFGPSDHASFYAKKIPVMHFFTGLHEDYHRPGDDVEKLNVAGMREVGGLVGDVALALAQAEQAPQYADTGGAARRDTGGGDRPYFGSIPDFSQDEPGYAISGVTKDSPAQRAGLEGGDVIIKLGDSRIGSLEDFDSALRKYEAGDKVAVVVRRGEEEVTLEVTLDPPR